MFSSGHRVPAEYQSAQSGAEKQEEMQQDGSEKLVPLEDSELRDELQGKAGTKFLDISQYDLFRHTRKLYDYIKSKEAKRLPILTVAL